MKLKFALATIAVLIFTVFASLAISLIRTSDLLGYEARGLAVAGESIAIAQELKGRLLLHSRNAFLYTLDQEPYQLERRKAERREIESLLTKYESLASGRREPVILGQVAKAIESYFKQRDELSESGMDAVQQYQRLDRYLDMALRSIGQLVKINQEQMANLVGIIDKENRMADTMAYTLLSVGGLIMLGLTLLIVNTVARPLTTLSQTVRSYGDSDAVRASPQGIHELKELATTFNSMADRLGEKRRDQLQFIATVAHDLRNPLSSMFMASDLLMKKCSEEDRDIFEVILRQTKALDRLVGDLLDTTRIEAGQFELELSDLDIVERYKILARRRQHHCRG